MTIHDKGKYDYPKENDSWLYGHKAFEYDFLFDKVFGLTVLVQV